MKRFLLVFMMMLFMAACSNATNSLTDQASNSKEKIDETSSQDKVEVPAQTLPLEGKTIILDPGHGGIDPGAVANDLFEKDLNLTISLKTKDYLEQQGATVFLTRETDEKIPFDDRLMYSMTYDADIFVSIHHNTNELTDINGTQVYYNEAPYYGTANPFPQESMELATHIHDKLTRGAGLNAMGVKDDIFYVLRRNTVPSVIVEVAFVTNNEDAEKLKNEDQLKLFSDLIGEGIHNYLVGVKPDQYVSE